VWGGGVRDYLPLGRLSTSEHCWARSTERRRARPPPPYYLITGVCGHEVGHLVRGLGARRVCIALALRRAAALLGAPSSELPPHARQSGDKTIRTSAKARHCGRSTPHKTLLNQVER
jgi:hypothetical protein